MFKFNRNLNISEYNRRKNWQNYRSAVSNYINYHLHISENDSLLILGAGNLDDLDVNIIGNKFSHITLSDIDKIAMDKAIERYSYLKEKTKIKDDEYTGLGNSREWNFFVNEIFTKRNKSEIDKLFDKFKDIVINNKWEYDEKYDTIIVCPIYTQLLLQQALFNLSGLESLHYPTQNLDYVQESVLELISLVIDTFNKNVLSILKEKGNLVIMSDIFEAKMNSDFYNEAHKLYSDFPKMEKFYEEYVSKYGLGLGDYGISNVIKLVSKKNAKWFEWPFDDMRIIYVKIVITENGEK